MRQGRGWALGALLAIVSPVHAAAPLLIFGASDSGNPGQEARLDGSLRGMLRAGGAASVESLRTFNPAARLRIAAPSITPEVLVDVVADQDPATTQRALEALGMRNIARASNLIGGWLPVGALGQLGQVAGVHQVRASMPRTRATGPVALQGDFVQGSSALRTQYPTLTGTGLTVGVLSDSFDCYSYYATHGVSKIGNGYNGYATNGFSATYADDVTSGALPAGVNILEEATCTAYGAPQLPPFSDEGRAMAQIIHAVAPNAKLDFYTAANSEADYATGISQLQKAGATIIVDDVGYPDEPFFQDGLIAQAVNTVVGQGVAYFSAAGNDRRHSYETTAPVFVAQGGRNLLNFDTTGATTSTSLPITLPAVPPGDFVLLVVQWDQPYVTGAPGSPGAANVLNFCIESAAPSGDYVAQPNQIAKVVASYPICSGANAVGADPMLILGVGNPANASAPTPLETLNLSIQLVSGTTPGRVKFLLSDNGLGASINSFDTLSPTLQGHPGAAGAVAVGAAFFWRTPACGTSPATLESYSSYGGDPILFDTSGKRLATPVIRPKPNITGPDGVNNTMLGFQLTQSTTVNPPWNSSGLLPTSVAGCQNAPQYPNFFGTSAAAPHLAAAAALLWQANPSLTASQVATALESTASPMAEGAQGSGTGFVQVAAALSAIPTAAPALSISPSQIAVGSTATLTWSSYATTGCTASGDWSGAQAASGTSTVTPSATGTLSYTLACMGANGTGPTSTVTLQVQSAASHHGGGALDALSLALLLLLLARRCGYFFAPFARSMERRI